MRTLTHIRLSATRVAGLGLVMAIFGLVATTWVDQLSSRDFGCSDDVRCATDLSVLGLLPITTTPDAKPDPPASDFERQRIRTRRVALQHQLAAHPLRILNVAPKTSPPA